MPASKRVDLIIEKGSCFISTIRLLNNSGEYRVLDTGEYNALMQIRPHPRSNKVLAELTTTNGGIIFENVTGQIYLFMDQDQTTAIDSKYTARAVYDLFLSGPLSYEGTNIPANGTERVLHGIVFIDEPVSRND